VIAVVVVLQSSTYDVLSSAVNVIELRELRFEGAALLCENDNDDDKNDDDDDDNDDDDDDNNEDAPHDVGACQNARVEINFSSRTHIQPLQRRRRRRRRLSMQELRF
jgi:hypothetical protein